jgi:hypothetical protein
MANNNNNIFGLKNLPKNIVPGPNVPTGNLLGINVPVSEVNKNLKNIFSPFEAAFFFDNDSKYIDQLSPCVKIRSHKVAGSEALDGTRIGSPKYQSYINEMTSAGADIGNSIASLIRTQVSRGLAYEEYIDFGSGISEADIAILKAWLEEHAGKKLAVLIDYDRTLTQLEGSYFLGNSFDEFKKTLVAYGVPSDNLTLEGFVEYYTGGSTRMKMLQSMFDLIYSTPNVSVYILTNNPACFSYSDFFTNVIKVLTKGRLFGLLCSAKTGGNKRTAIQQGGPLFYGLCPAQGGRRKKKTRRHQKKRKQTRRK